MSGNVKVTDTLQVEGHPDIFAVGDIISFNEQKQLAKVAGHAAVVVANITSLIQGKPAKKKYAGSSELIAITNGKVRSCSRITGTASLRVQIFRTAAQVTSVCFGVSCLATRWLPLRNQSTSS